MAAYAGVVSLMTTLDNVHNHPIHSLSLDKEQIQSLHQILGFLLDFIETYNSRRGSKEDDVLESQIASAAHAAEDVIESHVVDQIHAGSVGETSSRSFLDLEAVIKDMNCVMEKVMGFQETKEIAHLQRSCAAPSTSSINVKNVIVGFDDELIQIMDRLTGHQRNLQIVPIVGMGGIGKTTLANNVYENLVIVEHFDMRSWSTISQEYSVINILSEINKTLGVFDCEIIQETVDQLGEKLYKSLCGRRYLIVLDDIWNTEIWDEMRVFFPDSECRSRVLITTRISNVATRMSSSSFEMNLLDENKSWKLFSKKTFLDQEGCPSELEVIGKKIVRDCKGLPLSISVISGLLRSSRTREYWESVARDTNSILMMEKDEHCLNILSLSYNHLPAYLKAFFLYMGVFSKNYMVNVTVLTREFVAEGFIKSNKTQSLEEIAGDYLNELVDKNLVLVARRRWDGTIKYVRMHDLLREVCLRIAEKQKFFYKIRVIDNPLDISRERCIVFYMVKGWRQMFDDLPTTSHARTFRSYGAPLPFKCRLLRVLTHVEFESVEAISQLVNLRYLSTSTSRTSELPFKLPSSVSQLWNLQTLIMNGRVDAPIVIWHMRQLRILQIDRLFLPDPPPSDKVDKQDDLLLPNLHTLSTVMNFSFTEEVCKIIPNITELHIRYDDFSRERPQQSYYYLNNLSELLKLESLHCSFRQRPKREALLQSLMFPRSLRKLSLTKCGLRWDDLETYGFSMPHLEVLKLYDSAVVGAEWDCVEGAFPSLKFLKICDANLIKWTAEGSDFPVLEKLELQNLKKLEKIPSGMGDIQTLQYLHLCYCRESANISATEILEGQRSLGNDYLQVKVSRQDRHQMSHVCQSFYCSLVPVLILMILQWYMSTLLNKLVEV